MGTTPTYEFPYPESTDPPDAPTQFRSLAEAVDSTLGVTLPGSGTTANRPAPTPGALYFATDTNLWWHGIAVGGTNYWTPPPGTVTARLRATTVQSIPNNSNTAIILGAADYDPFGFWSSGTPTRFTPRFPGWFQVTGAVGFVANSTGYRQAFLFKNGVFVTGSGLIASAATGGTATASVRVAAIEFDGVADYVELGGRQNSGVALNTEATTSASTLEVTYGGP
jgi:hypothetical protein